MKRFTLFIVAALMTVVGATAQSKAKLQTNEKKVSKTVQTKAPERPVLKVTELDNNAVSQFKHQLPKASLQKQPSLGKQVEKGVNLQPRKRVAANKAQRRAAGVIIDQPAGTYHNMAYACSYFGYSWIGGQYAGEYSDALGEVVEGTDGCLYIHNLLTEMSTEEGYWVKAEKVNGEADTYVIHEQPIYVENYYGELYTYSIMKAVYNAITGEMVPAKNTDIKVTWKDGILRTASEFNNPNSLATTISAYDDSGYWSSVMNWNVTMTPMTDVAITKLPAGVEPQTMVMKYISGYQELESEDGGTTLSPVVDAQKVKIAVSGSDIYLQYYTSIDSWIKGTISGNKATFANRQYLGPDRSYGQQAYFLAGDADDNFPENVVFDYDPATNKLSNSKLYIYANGGKGQLYYLSLYEDPEIFPFVETAATPQPVDELSISGYNYMPSYGYGYVDFSISKFDASGNYLDTDKLYYKVYVGDDENHSVFTFTPEEYASLNGPVTEIPFSYNDGDFWCSGESHELAIYFNLAKNIGFQVIYKGGGEEHASEITWYWNNNGAVGYESLFPQVENPVVNSELATGEMALNLGEVAYAFGSGREATENYDVAMKIADGWDPAKLAGKKIMGVSVPFISIDGISNVKVWLSTSIELGADGKFTPNGPSKTLTLHDNGFTTVRFDEPYEIPEDGVYIGYSFTQAYTDEAAQPIALTGNTNTGGFMIHSDKVYRLGWADMTGAEGDLGIEAILAGGDADAADVSVIKDVFLKAGSAGKSSARIVNYGYNGLKSIAYDYEMLGYDEASDQPITLSGKGEITGLNIPRVFGGYGTAIVDIPAAEKIYDYVFYADVTKANDKVNAIEDNKGQCNVFVMNFVPKKRPLMEEYTGTWCGYCPRGFVGLEKMNELYPEDFVAMAYHSDDPMEVTTDFPTYDPAFPTAYLDRQWEVDPYYGLEKDAFGIDKAWLLRSEEFGVADIDVEASWSEDKKTINIKSTTTFARSEENANYAISYAVVADGLTGISDGWAQSNYYSEGSMGFPQYMDKFTNGESHVTGLVFNDVLVASSAYEGVEGSLPETIVKGTPYTHEFSFNVSDIVNTEGLPAIQDKNKVKVVAMLVSWNEVFNANKCKVTDIGTGIRDLNAAADRVVKTEYFDLSGRKVLLPSNGVYIQSQQLKNGETVTRKVVFK